VSGISPVGGTVTGSNTQQQQEVYGPPADQRTSNAQTAIPQQKQHQPPLPHAVVAHELSSTRTEPVSNEPASGLSLTPGQMAVNQYID
jgi:hypothetical protein